MGNFFLTGVGPSSIDFVIVCYLDASSTRVERVERHRLFMDILNLAERLEVELAFPTQILHVAGLADEAAHDGSGVKGLGTEMRSAQRMNIAKAQNVKNPE